MMTRIHCAVIIIAFSAVFRSVCAQDIEPEFIPRPTTTEGPATETVEKETTETTSPTTTEYVTSAFTTVSSEPTTEPEQTTTESQTEPNPVYTSSNAPATETQSPSTTEAPITEAETSTVELSVSTSPSAPEAETQLRTTTDAPKTTTERRKEELPVHSKPTSPVYTKPRLPYPRLPTQLVSCQVRVVKHLYRWIFGVNYVSNICSYCCYYHSEEVERCRTILPYFCRVC